MSSTDELDSPSITECSTASIESGSAENENTSNSNTVQNFIPVYVYEIGKVPGKEFSKNCRIANAMFNGLNEILDVMQSNGLCLSVFLDSFRRDGTVIPSSKVDSK